MQTWVAGEGINRDELGEPGEGRANGVGVADRSVGIRAGLLRKVGIWLRSDEKQKSVEDGELAPVHSIDKLEVTKKRAY